VRSANSTQTDGPQQSCQIVTVGSQFGGISYDRSGGARQLRVVVGLTAERCALPLASATLPGRVSESAALDGLLDWVGDGRSDVLVLPGEHSRHPHPSHWPRAVFDR
jgi:hypothetical protein